MWVGIVIAVIVVLLLLWAVAAYNGLVRRRNKVQEAWAGIDVQLTRRADLVPNLVETVKGYAGHEREVLESVTEARTRVVNAQGPRESGEADDMLQAALGRLFAVAEAYPDLKASANFASLQDDLSKLEEEISFARRYYNASAQEYNTTIQQVPTALIAGPFGFTAVEYFKADEADRAVPTVDFRS
jgi:LemA protein